MGISASTATLIAAGVSAATAVGGTVLSASAANRTAAAQRQANSDAFNAQNTGFWERAKAANLQLAEQGQAQNQGMADQQEAFTRQRTAETAALKQRQDTVDQENAQAAAIRAQADQQKSILMAATNKAALDQSQTALAANVNKDVGNVAGNIETASPLAHPTDNQGGQATTQAYASRLKEAADNVRSYGQRLATVASYTAPLTTVGQSIEQEKAGIMPTAVANQLLQSGQQIRLLPSDTAYAIAGSEGAAEQAKIRAATQGQLDVARVGFEGATNVANLEQGDTTQLAQNRVADAQTAQAGTQALGSIISGIGQIGAAAAGRYGNWIDSLTGGGTGISKVLNSPTPAATGWK
jgi:hypothetical protein